MRTEEVTLAWVYIDEWGDAVEDSETIECPVECGGCSEYGGAWGSDGYYLDDREVERRAQAIADEIHHRGEKLIEMTANGEPVDCVKLDEVPSMEEEEDE